MGTIAKGLLFGFAAGAPEIGLLGFEIDTGGDLGGDNGFAHTS